MSAAAPIPAESEGRVPAVQDGGEPLPAPVVRYTRTGVALVILAGIAVIAALYFARAFFVPLLIGILASYTLRPLVDWLQKIHIPPAVGAAIVIAVLVGVTSWMAYSLSDEATALIEKLPEAARKLRTKLTTG